MITKKLNEKLDITGGETNSARLSDGPNIGVTDENGSLRIRLARDITGVDSISFSSPTDSSRQVIISGDRIDMGGNKITGTSPGEISRSSTDAVNGSQLWETNQNIEHLAGDINSLDTRVNRVGAGAAALAALHPQDFDPDDKWDFAAGYGNYKDASAVAVGAFYRPTEDVLLSVGGSFSGGEKMVNAGVTFKLGQRNAVSRSRVSLARDMLEMKEEINVLKQKLAACTAAGPASPAEASGDRMFPDVPENHWAYTYVKELARRGYLEGYPDGTFQGDRSMTRYEYAAVIYRALQNGALVDGKMLKSIHEFSSELADAQAADRFRVDRVAGKDNDRHKIERVRINDKDDEAAGIYRDTYGSHIEKK